MDGVEIMSDDPAVPAGGVQAPAVGTRPRWATRPASAWGPGVTLVDDVRLWALAAF